MPTALIYKLTCPKSREVVYIGMTQSSLKVRLNSHSNPCQSYGQKRKWIKSLRRSRLKPIIELIKEVPAKDARFHETYWIRHYLLAGSNLFNHFIPNRIMNQYSNDKSK